MRLLAPLVENPWCLALLMTFALLLVISAALVAWAERARATTIGYPPTNYPAHHLAGSAPLEALAALHSRLLDLQRHLPPGSEDAHWLRGFARRLRGVMDEAYARLEAAPPAVQSRVLDRLAVEVEALASVVNLQLGATLSRRTDRQALEAQLAALRASLR